MERFKKEVKSSNELYEVIQSLDLLGKKYVIIKREVIIENVLEGKKHKEYVWYIEEINENVIVEIKNI